jgi:hypothetical protein
MQTIEISAKNEETGKVFEASSFVFSVNKVGIPYCIRRILQEIRKQEKEYTGNYELTIKTKFHIAPSQKGNYGRIEDTE